jgi:hypothetical protein
MSVNPGDGGTTPPRRTRRVAVVFAAIGLAAIVVVGLFAAGVVGAQAQQQRIRAAPPHAKSAPTPPKPKAPSKPMPPSKPPTPSPADAVEAVCTGRADLPTPEVLKTDDGTPFYVYHFGNTVVLKLATEGAGGDFDVSMSPDGSKHFEHGRCVSGTYVQYQE